MVISPDWERHTQGEYLEYLADSLEDWRETPPDRIADLMRDLAELSTGPLQTDEFGTDSRDHLLQLFQQSASGNLAQNQ